VNGARFQFWSIAESSFGPSGRAVRRSCLSFGVGSECRSARQLFELSERGGVKLKSRFTPPTALPLLQAEVIARHWVTNETFLAGYGLTQAMPGPLFTFAAYLGAVKQPMPSGIVGSAIALVAIFLPGVLLVYGMLPFCDELRNGQAMQAAMRGANAAVVGILWLALHDPISKSAVLTSQDFALALSGFLLLTMWKASPWIVVILLVGTATVLAGV
jgi:chromate transporter